MATTYEPLTDEALSMLRFEAEVHPRISSKTVLRLLASYDALAAQLDQALRDLRAAYCLTTPTASGEAPITAESPES